jgi:hypothetical protein
MLKQLIIQIFSKNTKRVTVSAPHLWHFQHTKIDNIVSASDIPHVAEQISCELEVRLKKKFFECWKANNTTGNSLGQEALFEEWYKKNKNNM